MEKEFIIIWVLSAFAVIVYATRVVIRLQSKKLGLDDLFLGIGALALLETYIVGTIVSGWAQTLVQAEAEGQFVYVLENGPKVIRYWFSTSATYIFSIWFIKLGIAWFLCRLSNNILQYGRWKNILFWYVLASFACCVIIFWSTCQVDDFIDETMLSDPPHYTKCHWETQVIAPAVLNVVADVILFVYPFPIIFIAKIPNSLRYSLLFVFALCGFVTASAIVRVIIMTAGRFLDDPNNLYALAWWQAIEGAVSLLVASLPVIGGRVIAKWRHILTRTTNSQSRHLSSTLHLKSRNSLNTLSTKHTINDVESGPFTGKDKNVKTVISAGSTLAGDSTEDLTEETPSFILQMAKIGRRGSNLDLRNDAANVVTVRKEVYIREEQTGPPPQLPNELPAKEGSKGFFET